MTIGKTPARGEQTYWINGKYNWVSISDMVDGGTIYTTKEKVSDLAVKEVFSATISKKGSLLMSFKLSIGKTSILDIDAYHNEAIIFSRPLKSPFLRDIVQVQYLAYFLKHAQKSFHSSFEVICCCREKYVHSISYHTLIKVAAQTIIRL